MNKDTLVNRGPLQDKLPEDALESYHTHGYYRARNVLPEDLLQDAQILLEKWVDAQCTLWMQEGLLQEDFRDSDFRTRFHQIWKAAGKPFYSRSPRKPLVAVDPERTFRIVRHPALLDLAQYFIGTDELISHGIWNSRPKSPDNALTDTPWHQDGQYFREQAHIHIMTIWFPLHEVGPDSSCLAVSPDVQESGLYENFEHASGFIGMSRQDAKALKEVPVPMNRGDALCFPQLSPHRAMPNNTDQMRWSMDMRFVQTDKAMPPALDQGLIARSQDPANLTSFEEWLGKWDVAGY